jgi:hypothetical protein
MRNLLFGICFLHLAGILTAQQNIVFTNPDISAILSGNYNPLDYNQMIATDPNIVAASLTSNISTDSLYHYLLKMSSFETRHTSSDTVSETRGFGAARRWAHQKMEQYSTSHNNRLEVGYLQFDQGICGVTQHRNVVAVLPGRSTTDEAGNLLGIVIIEGHLDSRCAGVCDTACLAEGIEDNASGSALVLELVRLMGGYSFDRTILFMLTTGEEQGLYGANALATYCVQQGVPVAAVLNNDVIGGIICGESSSPPSCPGINHIDSTQVRLFSAGSFNSPSKQLVRYIKLQYEEALLPHVKVPQLLTVMTAEDRGGRGGDHIPFRQKGFAAMRFTSANEHGDASNGPEYEDRQHTSEDILGLDTDNDGVIDSFFVDFNYLARNTAINANAAAFIAQSGCNDLSIDLRQPNWHQLDIKIEGEACADPPYRIALRTETNDWDTLITCYQRDTIIEVPIGKDYYVSACRINENGVESLFSGEEFIRINGTDEVENDAPVRLLQNKPNPFDESTTIAFIVNELLPESEALILVTDAQGKKVYENRLPIRLGINEIVYTHGYGHVGTYYYSLLMGGKVIDTKKMVFVAY